MYNFFFIVYILQLSVLMKQFYKLCTVFMYSILYCIIFTYWCVLVIGKSTHNQRIERLWRDVFEGVLVLFYQLFYDMERCAILDASNDLHLWCLHFVFIPLINRHMSNWRNAWVRHPMRSERNRTPMQLWIMGLNNVRGTETTISREVFGVCI